jgi:hypothetical protein
VLKFSAIWLLLNLLDVEIDQRNRSTLVEWLAES